MSKFLVHYSTSHEFACALVHLYSIIFQIHSHFVCAQCKQNLVFQSPSANTPRLHFSIDYTSLSITTLYRLRFSIVFYFYSLRQFDLLHSVSLSPGDVGVALIVLAYFICLFHMSFVFGTEGLCTCFWSRSCDFMVLCLNS